MSARRAEPVALGGGLTTRWAPPQPGTAIGAEPVAIPPGRATLRTRYHQTFIPWPGQPGHVTCFGRRPASRPAPRPESGDLNATTSTNNMPFPVTRVSLVRCELKPIDHRLLVAFRQRRAEKTLRKVGLAQPAGRPRVLLRCSRPACAQAVSAASCIGGKLYRRRAPPEQFPGRMSGAAKERLTMRRLQRAPLAIRLALQVAGQLGATYQNPDPAWSAPTEDALARRYITWE
jgi:hypothetical protein